MTRRSMTGRRAMRACLGTCLSAALLGMAGASLAAPLCQTQTQGSHTSKLCIEQTPFKHDYYTLWVDDAPVFMLPDDYVENISLTHTVPEDDSNEFPLSRQGMHSVTITGGCRPLVESQGNGNDAVSVETGRVCSFVWGQQALVKDMRFRFE
ncbi:putative membrane protein [Burkholderia plantarii]|uniref:Putative membrane protein n=2 Tax=Burkholderia plantarii TaxID=41899 RepID=A0A0B6SAH8_BURPL|nr:putative membrane protein [Burkholderia plantarii]